MDDKRQKIMIAVLAVLALGAGGYFVFLRDSGPSENTLENTAPRERVKRETASNTGGRAKRATRTTSAKRSSAPAERLQRSTGTTKTKERIKRGAGKRAVKKKKKKLAPAA